MNKKASLVPKFQQFKKPSPFFLPLFFILFSFPEGKPKFLASSKDNSKNKNSFFILIDPGHGGLDKGASNAFLNESDINLKIAIHLLKLFKKIPLFSAELTRSKDEFISLDERAKIANDKKADLLISIHINASNDPLAQGVEIYFQNEMSKEEKSMYLAKMENEEKTFNELLKKNSTFNPSYILNRSDSNPQILSILSDLKRNYKIFMSSLLAQSLAKNWSLSSNKQPKHKWISIRQAPFFVISQVNMPSVLIELGYITNKKESLKLRKKSFQKEQARKIYKGILAYKKEIDKFKL